MPLTREEIRNGWTEAELEAYRASREGLVPGLVVTEYARPRTPIVVVESVLKGFNPHRWGR